jgi:hypothetical protein
MFMITTTTTQELSLDAFAERLAARPEVEGIVILGSASQGTLNPTSDYDLYVVLSSAPVALFMALTTVDRRLTEVYFTGAATIDRLLAADQPAGDDDELALATRFLAGGTVTFDQAGRLARAQRKVLGDAWAAQARANELTSRALYTYWWQINYNLRQTRRMAESTDQFYLMAIDIRLMYGFPEVLIGYARARSIPWRGEKELLRYLHQADPTFLDLIKGFASTTDRDDKIELYAQAAALALEPIGGLWPADATALKLGSTGDPTADLPIGLAFWRQLIGEPPNKRGIYE